MKKYLVIILSIMLVALAACSNKAQPSPEQGESETVTAAPENEAEKEPIGILSKFSTTDIDGSSVNESVLAEYDLTMVNVWATFCAPCINEMPDLGEIAAEYKEQGVQILGLVSDVLNSDGSLSESQISTASDIVDTTKANYIHMLPSDDLMGLLSQISSVPTTFFVDKNGNLVGEVYVGSNSKEDWKTIINQTLSEVSV